MTPPNPDADVGKMPWPGDELVHRVTGRTDREAFFTSGQQSVRDLDRALASIGRQVSDYRTILDFGSGCGRIVLWLEHLAGTSSIHGVDIDQRAIEWSRHHMPWATFTANRPLPPLDYPDGYFDLVFSSSVLTHLDEDYQDLWLVELRRIVRPGGHLLLSVHGERAFHLVEESMRKSGAGDLGRLRRELGTKGISYAKDDIFAGGPFPDFYHSTFHAPWYVFEHWGRFLDVTAYIPGGSLSFQDFVLLERPVDDAPGAASGEPLGVLRTEPVDSGAVGAASGPVLVDEPADEGLDRAGRLLHDGFRPPPTTGAARAAARRLVDRATRSRAEYQRDVDEALFAALYEMRAAHDRRTTGPGGVPLHELHTRLWDALRLQGERMNRLEADLWEALRSGPPGPGPVGDGPAGGGPAGDDIFGDGPAGGGTVRDAPVEDGPAGAGRPSGPSSA